MFMVPADLGPWSPAMDEWDDILIGPNSMVPTNMLQELHDSQCTTNGPRDFWLWACLIKSDRVFLDEDLLKMALPLLADLAHDIPHAFLFWDRAKWDQHPDIMIPDLTEMLTFIKACEQAKSVI